MIKKSLHLLFIIFSTFILVGNERVSPTLVAWDIHDVLCSHPTKHGWQCIPNPQTFKLVKLLNDNGIRQVVFSNISHRSFKVLRSHYPHYFNFFDLEHSQAHAKGLLFKKPHALYIQKFLEKNPIDPHNIIFFDDKPENVEAARRQGIDAHIFYNPKQAQEILRQKGIL